MCLAAEIIKKLSQMEPPSLLFGKSKSLNHFRFYIDSMLIVIRAQLIQSCQALKLSSFICNILSICSNQDDL